MAYLHNDDDAEGKQKPIGQADSGLLSGYGGMTASALGPTALGMPKLYGTGGSAPTATGHVNFDRIYAANEGVANRDAHAMGSAAQGAAQKAQTGLAGLQQAFTSQSKAAQGTGPTAAQSEWAGNAGTGVVPGKQVVAAHYSSTGQSGISDPHANDAAKNINAVTSQVHTGNDMADKILGTGFHLQDQGDQGAAHSDQSYVTEGQDGLQSSDHVDRDANGNPTATTDPGFGRDPATDAANEAAVRAGATGQYAGPGSLQDMAGYQGLLADYGKASHSLSGLQDDAHIQGSLDENAAGPHIEGGSKLDAALIGQAGRPEFAQLGEKYNGLGGEMMAAQKASGLEGDAARTAAGQNATAYKGLLGQYLGRQGADQSTEDTSQAASDKRIADAQQHAANVGTYDAANKAANTGLAGARNTLHGIATALSPVDAALQATGNKTIVQSGTDSYGQQYAGERPDQFNAGNKSQAWGPDDADVFSSMTPKDWAEFNSLSLNAQRQWIADHKKKAGG